MIGIQIHGLGEDGLLLVQGYFMRHDRLTTYMPSDEETRVFAVRIQI